jgi:hypothetical protein
VSGARPVMTAVFRMPGSMKPVELATPASDLDSNATTLGQALPALQQAQIVIFTLHTVGPHQPSCAWMH